MFEKLYVAILFGRLILQYGRPRTLLRFGGGMGDQLLCTTVLKELRRRGHAAIWFLTDCPEIFLNSPDVDVVASNNERFFRMLSGLVARVPDIIYVRHVGSEDRDIPPANHLISTMCSLAGITGKIALKPYLYLSETEKSHGQLVPDQVAIQTSGLCARYPMRNKEWYPERFQLVVDALRGRFNFVQIGAYSDPLLDNVLDMRGKTSLREAAAILAHSLVFVGLVGGLMHLARAVDCRSVIVFGGRESPIQSGYSCNENLYRPLECSPCWRWNTCPNQRQCMAAIRSEAVIEAIISQALRHGELPDVQIDIL